MQNNNAPFKPIMQSQWNFVSIELIQIAGSELLVSFLHFLFRLDSPYFSKMNEMES